MARAGDVRDRILEDVSVGTLAFGARITIDDLARAYGTSHMPVREALWQLAGEGLVELIPGRGARLRRMDADFVNDLFATRITLEAMLARRAARNATPALVRRLEEIEAVLEAHVAAGSFATALQANHAFHQAVNAAAGNPQAVTMVDRHWVLLRVLWERVGYGPERLTDVTSDHRHIIRALAAREEDEAGVLVGAHVIKAKYELLRRMAQVPHAVEAA